VPPPQYKWQAVPASNRLTKRNNTVGLAAMPGFSVLYREFLNLSFGKESIDKGFNEVFIFLAKFFHPPLSQG
jgi:hypothetical protein